VAVGVVDESISAVAVLRRPNDLTHVPGQTDTRYVELILWRVCG
jgi:hypothetical protein